MDFYVISPVGHLGMMKTGNRIFALAHLYQKYEHYRYFIKQCKEEGWFVTMDNGAAENSLVTEDVLIDIVKDLMPNEVIAPDVLFNGEQTMKNLDSFAQRMKNEGLESVDLFGCPQGELMEDWLECYSYMLNHPDVKVIGLSKIAVPFAWNNVRDDSLIMESRHECYDFLVQNDLLKKPIHCLGAGDPREFEYYKDNPLMRSTDSCFSIWNAMCGIDWSKEDFSRVKTAHDYFERTLSTGEMDIAISNIEFLRENLSHSVSES